MDRSANVVPAAFVDPEALVLFLDALRRAGYRISTAQYIAAQDLVLALASQSRWAGDPERLRGMLRPLLCATPKEQTEFDALFDRWADRLLPARQATGEWRRSDGAARSSGPTGRGLADQLTAIDDSYWWLRRVASPLVVFLALVLVWSYFTFRRNEGTLLVHSTPDRAVVRLVLPDSDRTVSDSIAKANDSLGVTPLRLDRKPGRYTLGLALPGHRDTTVTVEVTPRTTRDVDVALRTLGIGGLVIRTDPDSARVVLDASDAGMTLVKTPWRRDSVREGKHQVRVLRRGYRPVERTVTAQVGKTDTLDIVLEAVRLVTLTVRSTPTDALVTLDGRERGRTPLTVADVEVGSHELGLSLAGFAASISPRVITRDTTVNVALAKLQPLHVTSRPPAARVIVNGDTVGVTPSRVELPPGVHDVVVNREGFEEVRVSTRVGPADTLLHADLVPVRRRRQRIAFSDSGATLLAGDRKDTIRVFNLTDTTRLEGQPPDTLLSRVPDDDRALSTDSMRLAAVPNDERVVVVDQGSGRLVDSLEAQGGHVSSIVFGADGRFLASGDASGGIRIWATTPRPAHTLELNAPTWTNRLAKLLRRPPTPITEKVRVGIGGHRVVTTSPSTGVKVWDLASGAPLATLTGSRPVGDSVVVSADGRRVIGFQPRVGTVIDVWGTDTARVHHQLTHSTPVLVAAMRRDAVQVASIASDLEVRLWDVDGAAVRSRELPGDSSELASPTTLEYSPDGQYLLALGARGAVRVWRTAGSFDTAPIVSDDSLVFAAFTPDGASIVTNDTTGTLRLWQLDRSAESRPLVMLTGVSQVAVGGEPGRAFVVTLGRDGTVARWDLDSLKRDIFSLGRQGSRRPEEARLAGVTADGSNVLVHFQTLGHFDLVSPAAGRFLAFPRADSVEYAALSADGKYVITASAGVVRTWNASGITELADLVGDRREVRGLAFSPDGNRLASGSEDGTIRLWDTRTFSVIDSIPPDTSGGSRSSPSSRDSLTSRDTVATPDALHDVAFSPDGKRLAAVGPTGVVRFYGTPGSRWRTVRAAVAHAWPVWIALILLPIPWLVYRWILTRRATAFVRRQTDEQPLIERITLRKLDDDVFPERAVLRVASRLRRRVEVPSPELDVAGSVTQTLRRGGVFTPAFLRLKVTPEYLALVDRATLGDQQCAFVDELLDRLEHDQVLITRYYFDGDPRVCFPADPHRNPVSLGALTQQYESHRVLLFAEAQRCFNPVTGEMAGWTDLLRRWPGRSLLTPEVPDRWGPAEDAVAREFPVYHASVVGLAALADETGPVVPNAARAESPRPRFPGALQRRSGRWIERDPLPAAEVDTMLSQVRAYLDDRGMTWLAACAVYPAMSWTLTLNLGHEIRSDDGAMLLDADRLLRLARLPWFRHGYMPDWLRIRLLDHLAPAQETQIRRTLELLLVTAVAGDESAFDLEVAKGHERTIHALAGSILRRLRRKATAADPLRDYVFAEFMSGRRRERLAVRVARVVPALGSRRAASGDGGGGATGRRRRLLPGLTTTVVLVLLGSKLISPAARAVDAAWLRIPESPRLVREASLVLDPSAVRAVPRAFDILGPTPDSAGTQFQDLCLDVGEVRVRAGWWMNAIELSCRTQSGRQVSRPRRGGDGGAEHVFQLEPGERIVAVSGSYDGEYGAFLFSLQLHTDRRASPIYGNEGPSKGVTPFRFDIPPGRRFAGFVGRAGTAVSSDGNTGDYLIAIGLAHTEDPDFDADPGGSVMFNTEALTAAARALCAPMNRMLASFPFNQRASADASISDVTALLAPGSGALWAFEREHLALFLEKRGDEWVATSGPVALSNEFVAFFNRAARLSEFLFKGQSRPRVDLVARASLPAPVARATLMVDDAVVHFAHVGQSRTLSWNAEPTSRGPSVVRRARLSTTNDEDTERVVAQASGDWALFRVIASAKRIEEEPGNTLNAEWDLQPDSPVDLLAVRFTFGSPFPMLASSPQCPAVVIRETVSR